MEVAAEDAIRQSGDSIAFAISSILVTLFQLRAVPLTFSIFGIVGQDNFGRAMLPWK
jgi:hypothetical protein